MKKLLAVLLLISISLCLLVGCTGSGSFYTVKVTGSVGSLMAPIMPIYQAGTVVKIKAHPVTDITLHVFVNDKEIPMSHFDSDYWGYEFIMPEENVTVHLTYDGFYGRDVYGFDELCYGLEHLDNEVTKVSIRTINYDEKYNFVVTKYSSRQEDIEIFKDIIKQKLIKADNNDASNANNGYEFSFYYNTESHGEMVEVLNFNDSFFTWNDFSTWQAFKFEDENYRLPTIENPDLVTYSFIYDGLSSDVKKYDDESFSVRYFEIDSVEFIPYEGEEINIEPVFYLDSRYGKINLLTPTLFELNGVFYEIVSDTTYWAYNYCVLESK